MSDLSSMLETAKSGLLASRYAMDITSQNIANAQVEGYTRQKPVVESAPSVKTAYGYLGTGVDVSGVTRERDQLIDQEIRNTNYQYGESSNKNTILDQIQSYLDEPVSGGIATELDNFTTAFQNLAANPEDSGVRQTVVQEGVTLSDAFNYLSNGLQSVKTDVLTDAQDKVKQINDLTTSIASLNKQISSTRPAVDNGAQDSRDEKLDELSKLIDIHTSLDNNGMVNVSTSGSTLISGVDAYQINITNTDDKINLTFGGSSTGISSSSGSIGASLEIYNTTIPTFNTQLNTVAQTLMTEVNNIHSKGYGLKNSTTGNTPTGYNFFTGTDAGNMQVNPDVLNDITNLAASADGTVGNNQVALDISNVVDKPVFDNGSTSILQYYRSLVTNIGYADSDSKTLSDSLDQRSSNLNNLKSSVSGVSLDDEMVNLIQYQRSFDASGKMITSIDEMYQTILDLIK